MLKYYLKTTLRQIKNSKIYSFINIFGLSLGMAGCLLIYLWVQDELSYDRYHENARRIFRVERNIQIQEQPFWPITSAPYGPTLVSEYPEIENQARVVMHDLTVQDTNHLLREENAILTDGSLFSIFDFEFEEGNPETALNRPNTVVLTRKKAKQILGSDDVMGKTFQIQWNGELRDFLVTGIMKKIPANSHFRFDMAISIRLYSEKTLNRWVGNFLYTYVLLSPQANPKDLEKRFASFIDKHVAGPHEPFMPKGKKFADLVKLELKPLVDIHLHPAPEWEIGNPGNAASVYTFSAIALLILLIACINFTNLSTARSNKRAKEVGLRKTVGAGRRQLRHQFLGETTGMAFMALVLTFGVINLILPTFNQLSGKEITLLAIFTGWNIAVLFILTVATGVLAGLYPAFILSAFEPVNVLKGPVSRGKQRSFFRQVLVVSQFVISILLIIGTLVVTKQMSFMQKKSPGFHPENVVVINPTQSIGQERYMPLRNDLLSRPDIHHVTGAEKVPGDLIYGDSIYKVKGEEKKHVLTNWLINYDYIETLNIPVISGRSFSRAYPTDASAVLINETAARELDLDPHDSIGQLLERPSPDGKLNYFTIIGIMKDFHFKTLHQKIEGVALFLDPEYFGYILVGIAPGRSRTVLPFIESQWEKHFPGQEFHYRFLDQILHGRYQKEMGTRDIFVSFTVLSIILASLGLLGLVSFAAEERTKEIGVRKVLGASVRSITALLSKEFLKCVLIANLIAWPLAYWVMSIWIRNFAYRTNMGIGIFIVSGFLALLIAFLAVSFQTIRAATSNPVEALRYE